MVASFMNGILNLAVRRGLEVSSLILVQDNRYTMEGSALLGTMTGGVLPVELDVTIAGKANNAALDDLVRTAVEQSPVRALLRQRLHSRFAVALNGDAVAGYDRLAAAGAGHPAALVNRVQVAGEPPNRWSTASAPSTPCTASPAVPARACRPSSGGSCTCA